TLKGRSLFRNYTHFRPLAFSNAFFRRNYVLAAPDTLISCDYLFSRCYHHAFNNNVLDKDTLFQSRPASQEETQQMQLLSSISDEIYNGNIFYQQNLSISTLQKIYHMRRMESAYGQVGEWVVEATAPV